MSNVLIGKTITGLKIADDRMAMLFQVEQGDVLVKVDADCCSHTWIEHIETPALGFPCVVIGVEDLFFDSEQDGELKKYGLTVNTDKGQIVVDYRNESNGYYGGSLVWPDENYFYGGVHGQNVSNEKWVDVNHDI